MGYTHMMVRSIILGQKKTNNKDTVKENDPDNIFACPVTNGDTDIPAKEESEKIIEETKEEKNKEDEISFGMPIEDKAEESEKIVEETKEEKINNSVSEEPKKKRGRKAKI